MKKPKAETTGEAMKTTITLPRALWREAHILALDTGRDFKDIVATALESYLKAQRGNRS
jgi:hypothetical protein